MNNQTVPIAAPDRMCGANAMVRTKPRPTSRSFNNTATARPNTMLPSTIPTTKTTVIRRVARKFGSVSRSA